MPSAFAEIFTVPFGWMAGDVRVYRLTNRVERLGDLKGGNCTLSMQLRVEVKKRDEKTADVRFQLDAPVFEEPCEIPSLRQVIWLQLSGMPLEAVLEPTLGSVTIADIDLIRDSLFKGLARSTHWFGRAIKPDLRAEVAAQLKTIFAVDAKIFGNATGYVGAIMSPVGSVCDTEAGEVIPVSLPSPFGGVPLAASVSTVISSNTPGGKDFTRTTTARIDPKAYAAALAQAIHKLVEAKASERELRALDQNTAEAGSTSMERIERLTGWVIETESKNAMRFNAGSQTDMVRMVYLPNVR
ncbi:MAG: hypothetical protein LH481_17775 [Burkholderiales bacterium]|nr:hypothetical protein [Burkholderiales bacterium]